MVDPGELLRQGLLRVSGSGRMRRAVERAPVSRDVVRRFLAGETDDQVVAAVHSLADTGRLACVDYLGQHTTDLAQARQARDRYLGLLRTMSEAGLTWQGRAEVSLKLSAVGMALPADGRKIALEHAREICQAAVNAGTTVTIDMEDHTTTEATLVTVADLRQDFPTTGAVVQSSLRRTEGDCRDLAGEGSRVRLCKGAYDEPQSVAFQDPSDVDKSFVRCLKILMAGQGYPMVATHDPRLLAITGALSRQRQRSPGSFEYQMLYGIRPEEQQRIADRGDRLRIYVPYGEQWYPYLMRRLAERPANTAFFLRAVTRRR